MLEEIVIDKNKAWEKDLNSNTNKFLVELEQQVIDELIRNRNVIHEENKQDFPLLIKQIENYKKQILFDGCGFFVISGNSFNEFTTSEIKSLHVIISKILGKLLIQNKNNEITVEVRDLGKSMKTGGRYHHTKEGGSYHTDGCHIYSNFPHYVGLLCVNPAKNGGESKFVSSYTIHNQLLKQKNILKILYEKFHIDKRNENEVNESLTQYEPIFQYKNDNLIFRYQRELIDAGHEKMNQNLTEAQINALDALDQVLANENFAVTYLLKANDMMFSNNKWLIHDRNDFEDFEDDNKKRCLVRTWIRDDSKLN